MRADPRSKDQREPFPFSSGVPETEPEVVPPSPPPEVLAAHPLPEAPVPAPSFLSALPKPVLFGLYGAVGGLLGALLLGEPAWSLLKPPPPPPPEPQVAVSASTPVRLYPGTSNTFTVQIVRERFAEPVTVTFSGLPAGVTINPIALPADKTRAEVNVSTAPTAAPGTVKVTATADGPAGKPTATTTFDLTIDPIPKPPPRLAVAVSPLLTVNRKGSCKFAVQVARAGFDGPVLLAFGPWPDGLTFPPVVVPAGKTDAQVTVSATAAAALGDSKLTVHATGTVGGAPLIAEAVTDVRVQDAPLVPVDVMFVLDCTASMEPFIEGVKDGIVDFAKELAGKQIDFRLGLLAFRDRIFGQEPEQLRFERDEVFTTDVRLFSREVGRLKCIGNDTIPESSLDGLVEAARQPFRQGATKVLILITDAAPLVPDKETKTVAEAAGVLKAKKMNQLHVVLRPEDVREYRDVTDVIRGKVFDLSRVKKGGEKFAAILPELSKAIADTVATRPVAAEVAAAPPLAVVPAGAVATPTAAAPPPAPTVKSLQSTERYAAGSESRLVLRSGVWAGCISALVCLALLAGQSSYLLGALPRAGGAAVANVGGLVVGLVGGAAGQALYQLAPSDPALVGVVFQMFGWALLGGLAGAGLAPFIPNLKVVHGLAGGALGGLVGGIGFLAVAALTGEKGEVAGRLVGGLLVGLFIGLMVALAEAAFRRAWLEVRYGTRETIAVTLGAEPVKVGGDSKVCTVWARGAVPLALRYFVRDGQVICDDTERKRETVVADGHSKEVGNLTVTVRTGASTTAPPAARSVPTRATEKAAPVSADDDDDVLPMEVVSPPPVPAPKHDPKPARPPVPTGSKPALPAVPSKPPAVTGPKHPDACPTCGRVNAGPKNGRYCMLCDHEY